MLVSGYEFNKLCKYSFCPRYPVKLFDKNIEENAFVFLNLDHFCEFVNYVIKIMPMNKFILLTHNHDITFTYEHFNIINNYVSKIYALNCNYKHEKIQKIPIGFSDDIYKPHNMILTVIENNTERKILLYLNFCVRTNMIERTACRDAFVNHDWVIDKNEIPRDEFYTDMNNSKYVLSPVGAGMDCHRIYEAIYLNTIPILKSCDLDDLYDKMPVVIVNDWSCITKDFLESNYEQYKKKLDEWKNKNPEWICASFWLK